MIYLSLIDLSYNVATGLATFIHRCLHAWAHQSERIAQVVDGIVDFLKTRFQYASFNIEQSCVKVHLQGGQMTPLQLEKNDVVISTVDNIILAKLSTVYQYLLLIAMKDIKAYSPQRR